MPEAQLVGKLKDDSVHPAKTVNENIQFRDERDGKIANHVGAYIYIHGENQPIKGVDSLK